MTNNADPNIFVRFATWVSPMHYSCELLFRRILKGRRQIIQTQLLSYFGYDYGVQTCYLVLLGFYLVFLLLGWLALRRAAKVNN